MDLVKIIDFLSENSDRDLDDIDIKPQIDTLERYRETNGNELLLKIIAQKYRPTIIEPNTVASYLWGCSQNYYGDVNKSCSSLCVNSIPYNESDVCQYSIWYYDNNKLIKRSDVLSSKAYIYVSKDFIDFLKEDINILRSSGVLFASVLTTNDSKHKILIPMTSIDNLPIYSEIKTDQVVSSGYSFIYWILLFLIVCGVIVYFKIFKDE